MTPNTLFYGDNLEILREHIAAESVDLVYLDPPFNSNRSYNVLFRDESGRDSDAQITAFEDSWHWGMATEALYHELVRGAEERLVRLLTALVGGEQEERGLLGRNPMSAYLVMMAARLVALRRALKPTGSLYLHCDPTASHYLKLVLDAIFGEWNFRNEIVWIRRAEKHNLAQQHMGRTHDTIFWYACSPETNYNKLYFPYDDAYVKSHYKHKDERGLYATFPCTNESGGNKPYEFRGVTRAWRYSPANMERLYNEDRLVQLRPDSPWRYKKYLEEAEGVPAQDVWTDVPPVRQKETLGYPTQKPLALLERIIRASSEEGDVVLDPFCGCGTAIDAAQGLGRRWLGIDITHLSVALMKHRLHDRHGLRAGRDYQVIGEPRDLAGARNLAEREHDGRYQFEWWALSLVNARPLGAPAGGRRGKKGADGGVDGVIHFLGERGRTERVVVQVKSGAVGRGDIGQLRGTLDRGAAIGLFITLREPSGPMMQEALSAGFYESAEWGRYPRLQILTIAELLAGAQAELPRSEHGTFARAQRSGERGGKQRPLL